MKYLILLASIVLLLLGQTIKALEVNEINSSDQLARFIYTTAKEGIPISNLLKGLESKETVRIPGYEASIPVQEVFASIALERFGDQLQNKVFKNDRRYPVREICAFRDSEDQVHRFSIAILQENQYEMIKQFLNRTLGT